jgi:hypothetical protein
VATLAHYGCVRRRIVELKDRLAEPILHTDIASPTGDIDWCGAGFCWGWSRDVQEGRLPADGSAAAQAVSEALRKKQKGNEAKESGLLDKALFCYDAAQKIIGRHCKRHMDCGGEKRAELLSLSVALCNNTALVSLHLAELAEKEADLATATELYLDAGVAAAAALVFDSDNAKVKHREEIASKKTTELEAMLR